MRTIKVLDKEYLEDQFGIEIKTTFFEDFSYCEIYDNTEDIIEAIKDTYKRAFNSWHDNIEFITELCMTLNWKIWQWYRDNETDNSNDNRIAHCYDSLWRELDSWILDNKSGEELSYFLRTTD